MNHLVHLYVMCTSFIKILLSNQPIYMEREREKRMIQENIGIPNVNHLVIWVIFTFIQMVDNNRI